MAEKAQGRGEGETLEESAETTRLRKLTIDAKHSGRSLDWTLQYCSTEDERAFVQRVWNEA